MIGRLACVFLIVAFAAVTAGPAAAQNKCAGDKIKAACKKTTCKAGLEAKESAKGVAPDPAKVAKCEATFSKSFAKSEAKGGCLTTGDAATIEAKVDAFVADIDDELDIIPTPQINKCAEAKIKAASKKADCKCKLEAKQAGKGGTIDPAKVAKCESTFSKSFAKAEAKGGCNTTGDAGAIEAKVDAFVADAAGELEPTTTTLPTTSTTTSTTSSTTSTTIGLTLKGVLPRSSGVFNYMGIGLPGADARCNTHFPGTAHCEFSELLTAESAGELDGIKDINNVTVTSFFVIDAAYPDTLTCNDGPSGMGGTDWHYGTGHTGSSAETAPLNNGTGDLGTPTTAAACFPPGSWVGCCP